MAIPHSPTPMEYNDIASGLRFILAGEHAVALASPATLSAQGGWERGNQGPNVNPSLHEAGREEREKRKERMGIRYGGV